ncbi:hypothetical protein [Nocardioides sp. Soil796]|uniref:hypothetical protein n=1 Tax=Nocardioides sp. Soil796 TaxID=1736412 RepID=UPI000A95ED9E|nr:hypothetical protein [Nocardioides sp. Soil796]
MPDLCVCGKSKSSSHYWATNGYATCRAKEQQKAAAAQQSKIVCPHCQTAGGVTRRDVRKKKGVSGGKATAALMTGGVSMLATGLSRKEGTAVLSCSNCGMEWAIGN